MDFCFVVLPMSYGHGYEEHACIGMCMYLTHIKYDIL